MASDAIVVGEDWISEHYFTTDATKESFKARVLARRGEWDALKEHGTPRTRFSAARSSLLSALATLESADKDGVRAVNQDVRAMLGYDGIGLKRTTSGPVTFVHAAGLEHSPGLAIVDALPGESVESLLAKDAPNLVEPFVPAGPDNEPVDPKHAVTSVARLLSLLFVHDDYKPAFALVVAGPLLLVAERERWPEGRYLVVDLQLVAERNDDKKGGEVDRALTCVAVESLAPDAQGDIWWTATLAESVKHTVGVSKDLREGVRLSIEIIANEVVARRRAGELDPLPGSEAQPLAKQSLRFLYRILFLLYAEASPELGVLPTGAPQYENGYSLDRLRELVQVPLTTQGSQTGTHFYESLGALFRLVDRGHEPSASGGAGEYADGLTFRSLRADLFKPEATAHIDEVGLGNEALQRVLAHLLLSKEQRGRDRGFISYAELGINQLGAVYEGLMSYTGFFAETDLHEVAKDGNAEKGSWVVPVSRSEGIAAKDFVTYEDDHGERKPVLHRKGSFVFRLAGRERQQSASYYTPEVLTRFVVSQALEELLDQDGKRTSASEILELTICEPALGSGAFAIEAVRQLAEEYLTRRQEEVGETVDPDQYPRELQKVKAYLALHQVYGVDLNATAVELAEISLWLDTMVEGLEAPWFGLHLRRGNSLIGARKAVYSRKQVEDKSWLKAVPKPVKPDADGEDTVDRIDGRIPHFLLPAEGWGAAADVGKDIRDLVPGEVAALKKWRRSMQAKPGKKQVDALVDLGRRVERLWELATQRLRIAERQVRRDLDLWQQPGVVASLRHVEGRAVTREEIEASLADPDGAYQRLRLLMDAWCALWFWPLTETEVEPPTLEQWHDALRMVLGADTMSARMAKKGDDTILDVLDWDQLDEAEFNDRVLSGAPATSKVLEVHPWLRACRRIADQHGFFHWALDFAPSFTDRGGFDLQVGNPPWVRPTADEAALLAEGDPWWQLALRPSQVELRVRREATLGLPTMKDLVASSLGDVTAVSEFLGSPQFFPHLLGLQPDLYKCFIEQVWGNARGNGVSALIHPEKHFTDESGATLRASCYGRLRRHWHFVNELLLFEIEDHKHYGVHVYGRRRSDVGFIQASWLYHPDTVERSLRHLGDGPEPGLKDPDGNWDIRPHAARIVQVDETTLQEWRDALENDAVPTDATRMFYAVNRSIVGAMAAIARADRLRSEALYFSSGWHEKGARTKGYFDTDWGEVSSWREAILQGPHFHLASPFFKSPNPSMLHNQDWTPWDLESLPSDALPVTSYKPRGDVSKYDADYDRWGIGESSSARDYFRVAWRRMAANTGERTLIPSIVPPGPTHIHAVSTLGVPSGSGLQLVSTASVMMSIVSDFAIRSVPKSDINPAAVARLPLLPAGHPGQSPLALRTLRLNCVTDAYSELWSEVAAHIDLTGSWAGGLTYPGRRDIADVNAEWTKDTPLRRAADRRQALVELDALVALMLDLSADELCTIYRTQFAVLFGYDRNKYFFDANGRELPTPVLQTWKKRGLSQTDVEGLSEEERTHTNASGNTYVYELPFVTLDREADMRQAYAHFEKVLAERS